MNSVKKVLVSDHSLYYYCDGISSLGKNMLVQRISGILSACNMQISNSTLCESSKCCLYSAVNHPCFPPTEFAVAWLGPFVTLL